MAYNTSLLIEWKSNGAEQPVHSVACPIVNINGNNGPCYRLEPVEKMWKACRKTVFKRIRSNHAVEPRPDEGGQFVAVGDGLAEPGDQFDYPAGCRQRPDVGREQPGKGLFQRQAMEQADSYLGEYDFKHDDTSLYIEEKSNGRKLIYLKAENAPAAKEEFTTEGQSTRKRNKSLNTPKTWSVT
jgi:hypothetical protein